MAHFTLVPETAPAQRITPLRGLIVIAIVGIAVAAAAIGVTTSLQGTTEAAAPDAAQPIVAGVVAAPGQELTGGPQDLPPLAIVLARPVPQAISRLTPEQQVARLATLARDGGATRLVDLGAAEQRTGDQESAQAAFRKARVADPGSIEAAIGIAIARGAKSEVDLTRTAATLRRLTTTNPISQIAWFNRGWVAVYRHDARDVVVSWRRTVEIAPGTALGVTATSLLRQIARAKGGSGG